MCGIAGVLSLGRSIEEQDLRDAKSMTALLRHRGPDNMGIWRDEKCILGNTCLKIIDLPCFEGTLNCEAVYHYLSLAYIPDVLTSYTEIYKIQGGCLFEVDLTEGKYEEREYYELRYDTDHSLAEKDLPKRLHDLMLDAVSCNPWGNIIITPEGKVYPCLSLQVVSRRKTILKNLAR